VAGGHFKMHPGALAEHMLVPRGSKPRGRTQLLGTEAGNAELADVWAGFLPVGQPGHQA
jgi:hypothetical protein